MKKKPKPFDTGVLARSETFVRSRFPDLDSSAAACYFIGLGYLERLRGAGVGGWIFASYGNWAEAAYLSRNTVMKKALPLLAEAGLIELIPGNGTKRKATQVRRKTIVEMKTLVSAATLNRFVPADAEKICEHLAAIGTCWDGKRVSPTFRARPTGRISMSNPCFLNRPENERTKKLATCLKPGERLWHGDYSQGEPTILLHALRRQSLLDGVKQPDDIYNDLASIRQIPRQEAKGALLALFYSPYRELTVPTHWDVPTDHYLTALVSAVSEYRQRLFYGSTPQRGALREVRTLLGRKMAIPSRKRCHGGLVLSWHIQGTLADIFNKALAETLKVHQEGRWRFLLQVYDGIYVAAGESEGPRLKTIMEGATQGTGIDLAVKQTKEGEAT